MRRRRGAKNRISAVRVSVRAEGTEDVGVGIVVARRPLTILVPSHLITLIEQGDAIDVIVHGTSYSRFRILASPSLQADHLSLLRFGRRRSAALARIRLPKHPIPLRPGQDIRLLGAEADQTEGRSGKVVDVQAYGDGVSIVTDIEVRSGDSGSAIVASGRLAAICQGMVTSGGPGTAVAVPLSTDGLLELRRARNRARLRTVVAVAAAHVAIAAAGGAIVCQSWQSFSPSSLDVADDGRHIIVRNAHSPSIRSSWTRSFETSIRCYELIPKRVGGETSYVAVGTGPEGGVNGAFILFDRIGRELWRNSVQDGECIYSTEDEIYDRYLVDGIYYGDLDMDGTDELLVSFVHDHFHPCKLVVLSLAGETLAEYWHPGYIRTLSIGTVNQDATPLVVVSASNNAIKTSWWNPQTLFAFRGLDISGQAPPYQGGNGPAEALRDGSELWYRVIENVDPELIRAKCYKIDFAEGGGGQGIVIRGALTDGRFYYLDEHGNELKVELGDQFLKNFPDATPPALVELPLRGTH
ncbi:hypothetical protein KJ567_02085 [Candidatus Bipolaricaulota bacterium]|nr:hypothetical protein [Candidatus Bipolaricaulota bacterium]